jgi:hypothetical protein
MNYKLHITKIQSVDGINNRVLVFIGKLEVLDKELQNIELETYTQALEKTLCIGHLIGNLDAILEELNLLIGYRDDRMIELLNIYSEIRKIITSMNFLYDVRQADQDTKDMDERQEALQNIDNSQL